MDVLSGYLALSVGVAGGDRQARVGAAWAGWWESSKRRLPDRRAFITRVGRVGESKDLARRWQTGVSRVASSCAAGTLFRSPLDKVYI